MDTDSKNNDIKKNHLEYSKKYSIEDQYSNEPNNYDSSYLKYQLIKKLIHGEAVNENEIVKMTSELDINFPAPYFCVLLLQINERTHKTTLSTLKDDIINALQDMFTYDFNAFCFELFKEDLIAMVINLESKDSSKNIRSDICQSISLLMEEQLGLFCSIGVGNIYHKLININRSFIEASAAMNYKLFKNNENAMFFEYIQHVESEPFWCPIQKQLRFAQSLKQGDRNIAQENLKGMIASISENKISMIMFKYICFGIVNLIAKTVSDMNIRGFSDDINDLMDFSNLNELEKKLNILVVKLCEAAQQINRQKDAYLIERIIEYINSNINENNLILEKTAEHFSLSVFSLNCFFFEQTGYTFSDYVSGQTR